MFHESQTSQGSQQSGAAAGGARHSLRVGVDALLYYPAFFITGYGAARGNGWIGPLAIGVVLAIHVWMSPRRGSELKLLALFTGIGLVVDSALGLAGIYQFKAGFPGSAAWICPPWLLALWPLFGMLFTTGLRWMAARPALSAALCGVLGPISYWAGDAVIKALTLQPKTAMTFALLAAIWAALGAALAWCAQRICGPAPGAPAS